MTMVITITINDDIDNGTDKEQETRKLYARTRESERAGERKRARECE